MGRIACCVLAILVSGCYRAAPAVKPAVQPGAGPRYEVSLWAVPLSDRPGEVIVNGGIEINREDAKGEDHEIEVSVMISHAPTLTETGARVAHPLVYSAKIPGHQSHMSQPYSRTFKLPPGKYTFLATVVQLGETPDGLTSATTVAQNITSYESK